MFELAGWRPSRARPDRPEWKAPCRPVSRRIDTAATNSPCVSCRRPGWPEAYGRASQAPIADAQRIVVSISFARFARPHQQYWVPIPLATGRLRSLHTPCCVSHCPNSGKLREARSSARPATFRRWKLSQFRFTLLAVNTLLSLGPIPKATTPFANLQLHAHFHD